MVASLSAGPAFAQSKKDVPAELFQGVWQVEGASSRSAEWAGAEVAEVPEEERAEVLEIRFRKHTTGAIQQVWTDATGEVVKSRGIEILEISKDSLTYREWSDHPVTRKTLTVAADGTATLVVNWPKEIETIRLRKAPARDKKPAPQGEPPTPAPAAPPAAGPATPEAK